MDDTSGLVRFIEKLFTLLDQGRMESTYKYAVLLGLIDLCLEFSSQHGEGPTVLTIDQLAEKLLGLYWNHTDPYVGDDSSAVLRQSNQKTTALVEDIKKLKAKGNFTSPAAAEKAAPRQYASLLRRTKDKLVEMPLPKLQRVGGEVDEFIYHLSWKGLDKSTRRRRAREDNAIHLLGRSGTYLAQLAGLLRSIIQQKWASRVAEINQLEESKLQTFLFGTSRTDLTRLAPYLRDLQEGVCFYCGERIGSHMDVDHFIPWSRYPDNGIENLVAAHDTCNRKKLANLASTDHVASWLERFREDGTTARALEGIAEELQWERHPPRTLGVARGMYLRLPSDAFLWRLEDSFEHPDVSRLEQLLSSPAASHRGT